MKTIWVLLALKAIFTSEYASENYLELYHMSMPLPIVEGDKIYIKVIHVGQSAPIYDRPIVLYQDLIISKVSYPDLEITYTTRNVKDYGVLVDDEGAIGFLEEGINSKSIEEFLHARKRYNILISEVIENNWLVLTNVDMDRQKIVAKELQDCWDILKVTHLKPIYEGVGGDFLKWMNGF